MKADLELLRTIFSDGKIHITLAVVTQLEVAPSMAIARVKVKTLPESLEVIAQVSSQARLQDLPQPNDLGILAYSDTEEAYWITTLSYDGDPISARAAAGDTVMQARQSAYLLAADNVYIGQGANNVDPTEPLALGNVLISCFTDLLADLNSLASALNTFTTALKTGPVGIDSIGGPVVTGPVLIAACTSLGTAISTYTTSITTRKSKYLTTAATNIVSGIAFTERGS